MAKTKSAEKAQRVAQHRRVFNLRHKNQVKDSLKKVQKLITGKQPDEAAKLLPAVYKALDKAAKHGTIKKNAASRIKSRVTKRVSQNR